jgi:hypothetical protein
MGGVNRETIGFVPAIVAYPGVAVARNWASVMWFKVENKRSSVEQKFIVRCKSEIGGRAVVEERPAKGTTAARKTAEILATSLNVTATVYGADADGEFVYASTK